MIAKASIAEKDFDGALEDASRSCTLYEELGDTKGQAAATVAISHAYAGANEVVEALRAAETASRLCAVSQDLALQAEVLVTMATLKLSIIDARGEGMSFASSSSLLNASESALAAVKAHRSGDLQLLARAKLIHAKVLLQSNAHKGSWMAAKEAAKLFRKLGDTSLRAQALVTLAAASLYLSYLQDARSLSEEAFAIFDKEGDNDGKTLAFQVSEGVSVAMGLPTQAELRAQEERQRQEMLMQQYMMLQNAAAMGGGQMMVQPQDGGGDMPASLATQAPKGFSRDGASPLDMSKGVDIEVIQTKIAELVQQI